jgi:hypothetical protein
MVEQKLELETRPGRGRGSGVVVRVNETTFEVGLLVAAVEHLIRSRIDALTLASGLSAGAVHGRRYVGRVVAGRFEVWIRRRSYNSVAPRLTGTIESNPGGAASSRASAPAVSRGTPHVLGRSAGPTISLNLGQFEFHFGVTIAG